MKSKCINSGARDTVPLALRGKVTHPPSALNKHGLVASSTRRCLSTRKQRDARTWRALIDGPARNNWNCSSGRAQQKTTHTPGGALTQTDADWGAASPSPQSICNRRAADDEEEVKEEMWR